MDNCEIIGYIATFFSCTAYIPQLLRIWKGRSVKDVSLMTYFFLFIGTSCWLFYSFLLNRPSLILANCIALSFIASVIFSTIYFRYIEKKSNQFVHL